MAATKLPQRVTVIGMTIEARRWVRQNCGQTSQATLIKWQGERLTVRAPNRRQRTFEPQEATWAAVQTVEDITNNAINLTTIVISDWLEEQGYSDIAKKVREHFRRFLKS